MTIKAGTLLLSTEGGHLYTFDDNGGLKGMGKNTTRDNEYAALLVQRVKIDITMKKKPSKR